MLDREFADLNTKVHRWKGGFFLNGEVYGNKFHYLDVFLKIEYCCLQSEPICLFMYSYRADMPVI